MSNATTRTNARPTPKLAQRSAIRRESRASEAAPLPSALAPSKPSGDSAIFALVTDWRALKPKIDEAEKALRIAEDNWVTPEFPRTLIATVTDKKIFPEEYIPAPGKPYGKKEVDYIRCLVGLGDILRNIRRQEAEIIEARSKEIVEAWRKWTSASEASPSVREAEARRAEMARQEASLFHRLALASAQSTAGVMAKLSVASAYAETGDVLAKAAVEAECTTLDVLRSAAADFKRLRLGGDEPRAAP
jgi:hypothetical protein